MSLLFSSNEVAVFVLHSDMLTQPCEATRSRTGGRLPKVRTMLRQPGNIGRVRGCSPLHPVLSPGLAMAFCQNTLDMHRRAFLIVMGGAAAAWPVAARAQPKMPMIGFLAPGSPGTLTEIVGAVRQGLGESGFVEGRNVAMEFRYAGSDFERLPALGAELVSRRVNVVFAMGAASAVAAKSAITTIPVVFYMGEDPVSLGVEQRVNRP